MKKYVLIFIFSFSFSLLFAQVSGTPYLINPYEDLDTNFRVLGVIVETSTGAGLYPGGNASTQYSNLDNKLEWLLNFGPFGAHQCISVDVSFTGHISSPQFHQWNDPGIGVDAYVMTDITNVLPDPANTGDILNFIQVGGAAISFESYGDHNGLSTFFGLGQSTTGSDQGWTIVDSSHPIFDGPFGVVDSLNDDIWNGSFYTGLPAGFTILAVDSQNRPTIVVNETSYTNGGKVLFVSDLVTIITNISGGNQIISDNEIFWANLIAWAITD